MKFLLAFSRMIASLLCILVGTGIVLLFALRFLETGPEFKAETLAESAVPGVELERDGAVTFEVRFGESAAGAGRRLQDAGLIRSRELWILAAKVWKEPIKAGVYRLTPPMDMLELRRILVSGRQMVVKCTVPEGFTLRKTAELLEEREVCSADDFLEASRNPTFIAEYGIPANSLEGFLYPDTYFFPRNYPADRVVRTMTETFFTRVSTMTDKLTVADRAELFKKVTLASIVEREYRLPEEAPKIASVFNNRIARHIGLESCATVEYIITEIQLKPHPGYITTEDTHIASPYNTYLWAGLPPGPICSPGPVALKAVLQPIQTPYYYFRLVDPDKGEHAFSENLQEHISAKIIYLKKRAQSR